MAELDGRIAIITGGGRGIGLGIAERLCSAGATAVIAELNEQTAREGVATLTAMGATAWFQPTNVTQEDSVQKLVDAVLQKHGWIDILINNAGLAKIAPTETQPTADWQIQIDVMLTGVFLCTQRVGRVMLDQGRGVILNISSIGGLGGWPMRSAYNAAKAGVISLTENIGCEWARRGVRVVSIAPGVTRTAILQQMVDEKVATLENYNRRTPMGRVAEIEEIAKAAQFLVSDRARYITATTLTVDGGWTAWDNLPHISQGPQGQQGANRAAL